MGNKNTAKGVGLEGAFAISPSESEDGRGGFFKNFTDGLLASIGAKPRFSEEFYTVSREGVVRGLHYQLGEAAQAKLVWCYRGSVFDVIVDLRKGSPTFGRWASTVLSEENRLVLYVPRGFAHGLLATSQEARVLYKADNPYSPQDERGIIYSDKELGIKWPKAKGGYVLSEKDGKWPSFRECEKF